MTYELLAHESFQEQFAQFQVDCAGFGDDLIYQLKVIQANPFAQDSRTMHEISDPDLVQKVLRRWVGGPDDYRLIFVVERQKQIALPAFVSLVPKAQFDYATAQWKGSSWLALCQQVAADLAAGNTQQFRRLRLPN